MPGFCVEFENYYYPSSWFEYFL